MGQQLFACRIQPRDAHAARECAVAHTFADAPAGHDGYSRAADGYVDTKYDGYSTAYRYASAD
jgi:hypothetical protein